MECSRLLAEQVGKEMGGQTWGLTEVGIINGGVIFLGGLGFFFLFGGLG